MKPINLKLKGLNSYIDEQEIDFSKLCSKGLFGIFGPTGSGKSTILDAITISLYGAQGMARDTKDFINTEVDKAVIKYVFSLKNNYGLRFYDISRSFKNSKTGLSNDMAKLLVSDENGEVIEILDKAKEVNNYLENLLGLTSADFMRSVVLPQGKFSEFLQLKDADRRKMIERLLNLQEFGVKLSDKIKRLKDELKSKIEYIDGSIMALSSDELESVDQVKVELEILNKDIGKMTLDYKEFSKNLEEVRELYKKTNDLLNLEKDFSLLSEKLEYIENLKSLIEKATQASKITPIYLEFNDENDTLNNLKSELSKIDIEFSKVKEENIVLSDKFIEKTKEKDGKVPDLVDLRAKLSEMVKLKLEVEEDIKKRDDLRSEYKKLKEEYEMLEKKYIEVDKTISETSQNINKLEELKTANFVDANYKTMVIDIKHKDELLKKEKEKLENLNLNDEKYKVEIEKVSKDLLILEPNILKLKESLDLSKVKYEKYSADTEQIEKKIHEFDKSIIELKNTNENYEKKLIEKEENLKEEEKLLKDRYLIENKLEILKKDLEKVEIELDKTEAEYESFRVNQLLNEIAGEIIEGEPCPLCGSKDHPSVHKVHNLDNVYDTKLSKLRENHQSIKTEIIGFEKDLEFNDLNFKLVIASKKTLETFTKEIYDENLKNQVNFEVELEKARDSFKKTSDHKKDLKEEIESNEKILTHDLENLNNLNNSLKLYNERLHSNTTNILEIKKMKDEHENFINENLEKTSFDSAQKLLDDLSKKELILSDVEKKLRTSREFIENSQKSLKVMQVEKDNTYKNMTKVKERGTSINDFIKNNQAKIVSVTDKDPREELEKVEIEIKNINKNYMESKDSYESNNEKFLKLEKVKNELDTKVESSSSRLAKMNIKLSDLISKSIFENLDQFKSSIVSEEVIMIKSSEVDLFEGNYSLLKSNILKLKNEVKGNLCTKEKYEEALSQNEKYNNEISEIRKIITIKETKLTQLQKNEIELIKLNKEKNEVSNKLGTINEISRLTNGNKFVEFVAINHLRYIAIDASTRLLDITNGRYSLELDYSGGFIICDNYNGGVKRSCQSLSGGETFMTSLSLALALSTHIQLKGSVALEFFILDEGFGTLDVDLLDTVMNSLEKLRSKNMSVGVISHVEELKNRVPMRLSVIPAEPGLSGTKLKIEAS